MVLNELSRSIRSRTGPILVGGDFNAKHRHGGNIAQTQMVTD